MIDQVALDLAFASPTQLHLGSWVSTRANASANANATTSCAKTGRRWTTTRACASRRESNERLNLHRRAFLAAAASLAGGVALGNDLVHPGVANPSSLWNPHRHDVLFDSSSGSFIPASSLQTLLARYKGLLYDRCIVAGEVHDKPRTHAAQLAVLRCAAALPDGRPLVVGFEQFYRVHNPILEQYVRGQISLPTLLRKTDWESTWGYDAALYAPLFAWCRAHGVQMVGLNVPRSMVTYVSQVGLNGLSPELRSYLPKDMDVTNSAHYKLFVQLIGVDSHALGSRSDDMRETLRKWFEAQCTWDEYMAETVRQTCESMPDARVVALIGSGHVEGRVGFPNRIEKRLDERPLTIVPREVRWTNEDGTPMPDINQPEKNVADIVWYTNRQIDMS